MVSPSGGNCVVEQGCPTQSNPTQHVHRRSNADIETSTRDLINRTLGAVRIGESSAMLASANFLGYFSLESLNQLGVDQVAQLVSLHVANKALG